MLCQTLGQHGVAGHLKSCNTAPAGCESDKKDFTEFAENVGIKFKVMLFSKVCNT